MPASVDDASDMQLLVANPSLLLKGSADSILDSKGSLKNVDIYNIQTYMFYTSGLPNHNEDREMCPLDFRLFKFVWNPHFGLHFELRLLTTSIHIDFGKPLLRTLQSFSWRVYITGSTSLRS